LIIHLLILSTVVVIEKLSKKKRENVMVYW